MKFSSNEILIISSINDDLSKKSSAPSPEVKKTVYNTFNDFLYFNRNFQLLERVKSFPCFKHQINIANCSFPVEVSSSINQFFV